jgi:DNA-binding XRE family transcriptional regulator
MRTARALANWSQGELAERAGISKQSVNRIEGGGMDARFSIMNALADALRSAGVEMGEDASTGVVRVSIVRDRIGNDSPADGTRSSIGGANPLECRGFKALTQL